MSWVPRYELDMYRAQLDELLVSRELIPKLQRRINALEGCERNKCEVINILHKLITNYGTANSKVTAEAILSADMINRYCYHNERPEGAFS